MGALIAGADHIQQETGANTMRIHHTGWDADHARGHSSQLGASDTELTIAKKGTMKVTKQKDGPDGDVFPYIPDTVDLGLTNYWGEPVTSIIASGVTESKFSDLDTLDDPK